MSTEIQKLDDDLILKVRSLVTVNSFDQALEEVVLNSVDAGATIININVNFQNLSFEVQDNGWGFTLENLMKVGERYSTSKCTALSDLKRLTTFGYRGESLASLSEISHLEITSTFCDEVEVNHTNSRSIKFSTTEYTKNIVPPHRDPGTSVYVRDLFKNFPVRRQGLNHPNLRLICKRRIETIALSHPNIRFSAWDQQKSIKLVNTPLTSDFKSYFQMFFGEEKANILEFVSSDSPNREYYLSGYLSYPNHKGHPNKSLQFIYINNRLVLNTKIHRFVNQLYQKYRLYNASKKAHENQSKMRKEHIDVNPIFILFLKCSQLEYERSYEPSSKTFLEFNDWKVPLNEFENVVTKFLISHKSKGSTDDRRRRPSHYPPQSSTSTSNSREIDNLSDVISSDMSQNNVNPNNNNNATALVKRLTTEMEEDIDDGQNTVSRIQQFEDIDIFELNNDTDDVGFDFGYNEESGGNTSLLLSPLSSQSSNTTTTTTSSSSSTSGSSMTNGSSHASSEMSVDIPISPIRSQSPMSPHQAPLSPISSQKAPRSPIRSPISSQQSPMRTPTHPSILSPLKKQSSPLLPLFEKSSNSVNSSFDKPIIKRDRNDEMILYDNNRMDVDDKDVIVISDSDEDESNNTSKSSQIVFKSTDDQEEIINLEDSASTVITTTTTTIQVVRKVITKPYVMPPDKPEILIKKEDYDHLKIEYGSVDDHSDNDNDHDALFEQTYIKASPEELLNESLVHQNVCLDCNNNNSSNHPNKSITDEQDDQLFNASDIQSPLKKLKIDSTPPTKSPLGQESLVSKYFQVKKENIDNSSSPNQNLIDENEHLVIILDDEDDCQMSDTHSTSNSHNIIKSENVNNNEKLPIIKEEEEDIQPNIKLVSTKRVTFDLSKNQFYLKRSNSNNNELANLVNNQNNSSLVLKDQSTITNTHTNNSSSTHVPNSPSQLILIPKANIKEEVIHNQISNSTVNNNNMKLDEEMIYQEDDDGIDIEPIRKYQCDLDKSPYFDPKLEKTWETPKDLELDMREIVKQYFESNNKEVLDKNILKEMRFIKQWDTKFLLCESKGTLYILDQHAVSERVKLEAFERKYRDNGFDLCPMPDNTRWPLTEYELELVRIYSKNLMKWGFRWKMNPTSIQIQQAPMFCLVGLGMNDLREFLYLLENNQGSEATKPPSVHRILAQKACRTAIKFNQKLTDQVCHGLIEELNNCNIPFQCAHGRPSIIPFINYKQLYQTLQVNKQ